MSTERPSSIDLLIIGRGPAGVACALQAHRDGLRVVLVGDEPVGGLVRAARRLDNLPGAAGTSGAALADRMARQVETAGVPTETAHIVALRREGTIFLASMDGNAAEGTAEAGPARKNPEVRWSARAVCLAVGTRPRPWPPCASGDVVRDARALPEHLDGRRVVVVGGGEAALDTALTALDRGAAVTVLVRGEVLRGAPTLLAEVQASRIEVRFGAPVADVSGADGGWAIRTTGGEMLAAAVLVACVGREPRRGLWECLGEGAPESAVVQARRPGVFTAGDFVRGRDRYVATAMGDGQRVALAAVELLGRSAGSAGSAGSGNHR